MNCWDGNPMARPTFIQVYEMIETFKLKIKTQPNVRPDGGGRGGGTLKGLDVVRDSQERKNSQNSIKSQPVPNNPSTRNMTTEIKRTASNSSINPVSSPASQYIEDQVWSIFLSKEQVPWEAFSNQLAKALLAPKKDIDSIRYLFEISGIVDRRRIFEVVSSIRMPRKYLPNQHVPSGVSSGYLCSTIIEIASPEWFHRWLGAKEAQDKLTGKPTGTFLLRFSTPGSYSLSVTYSDTVGHW